MFNYNRQQLEADLQLIEVTLHRIRSGAGLTASAPDYSAGYTQQETKTPPKKRKKALNPATIQFLATYLNRPDIPKLFNLIK